MTLARASALITRALFSHLPPPDREKRERLERFSPQTPSPT
jgi:hypothetical protein